MTTKQSPSARYDELVAAIETAAPEAGFWMKGKPLDFTLEDVMWACQRLYKEQGREIATNANGIFVIHELGHWFVGDLGAKWALGKPLSEQSPETIAFLHSLLSHEA